MRWTLSILMFQLCHGPMLAFGSAVATNVDRARFDSPEAASQAAGDVVLNEIVSSNTRGLEDEDGDRPDWVELRNLGTGLVDLHGAGLSDEADQPFKWRFPRILINPGGHMLVFCSGKNRTNTAGALHANFSLKASGELLSLTSAQGTRMDARQVPVITSDVSWGRRRDLPSEWVFFETPTPRAGNAKEGFKTLLTTPAAAPPSGFYTEKIHAELLTREPGASIYYTWDGSEPTRASASYASPLAIQDRGGEPNSISMIPGTATVNQHTDGWFPPRGLVAKATVLRARAFREGAMPGPTLTRTYFVGPRSPKRFQLPVVSIVTDTNGLFNYETGIYVLGKTFDDHVKSHPGEPLTGHTPANYQGRGPQWERLAHLEWFAQDGSPLFAGAVELEIQGQSSRSFRQKSLGVRALGADFPAGVFSGLRARGTGQPISGFKHLRLANSGNDWSHSLLRDGLCHTLAAEIGIDVLANQPAVVFLDGEFWGIHNVREQQNAAHLAAHYGLARRDIVICEGAGALLEGLAGDEKPYLALREYAATHDLSQPAHYDYVSERMDIENFLSYCAAEIYFANADWPHNNIRFWRKRTPKFSPDAPPGHDGRWRWLLFDTDLSYAHPWSGGFGDNTLAAAINPKGRPPLDAPWSTVLLRQLLQNGSVRDAFLTVLADYLNTAFREERAIQVLDAMVASLSFAMPEHIQRWRTMEDSMAGWTNQLRSLRRFATQRPIHLRQHAVSQFKLQGYGSLSVDTSPPGSGMVRVNSITVGSGTPGVDSARPYPWRGVYFLGVPLRLEAVPSKGWVFAGWESVTPLGVGSVQTWNMSGPASVKARFVRAPIRFTRVALPSSTLVHIAAEGPSGAAFALERSGDLAQWTRVTNAVFDDRGSAFLTISVASIGSTAFFRLLSE